jgi:hypothetical protein
MGDSTLFIVRIWRQVTGGFRASVRKVDDDESHLFTAVFDAATDGFEDGAAASAHRED